jgi:hypothetical protein
VLGLALLGLWPSPGVAEVRRFSGRVERVELADGVVEVHELAARGRTLRHLVHVDADTPIVSSSRLRAAEMRGPSAYGEVPVSLVDVLAGDFVIVEAEERDGRQVARRVTIVETPARR